MSSPISIVLKNLRVEAGVTQVEWADRLGYEQAYVSSLEIGLKPPSQEYLDRLFAATKPGEHERKEIEVAMQQSRRRFVLPAEGSTATYKFCNALWDKIDDLHPALIDAMHQMLIAGVEIATNPRFKATRLRRKQKGEATM